MTLRELVLMEEGRNRNLWAHTSSLMALLAEKDRDPKKKKTPFSSADFNPFDLAERAKKEIIKVDTKMGFKILKAVFCGGKIE